MGEELGLVAPLASPSVASREASGLAATPSGVWVVVGMTGEYSDRSEWTVYAFSEEQSARDYVGFLSEKYRELGGHGQLYDWDKREALQKAMIAFDPEFDCDYTGTHWRVVAVPWAPTEDGTHSPPADTHEGASAPSHPNPNILNEGGEG